MEKKKYQIDFRLGCANYQHEKFTIFVDAKGLKIFTKNGTEYLTEQNSEVL